MFISYSQEAFVFFGTILGGVLIGIIFDVYRVLHNSISQNIIFIGVWDLVFWVVLSIIAFATIFITNSGQVRWYEILGIILGFIIYGLTVSRFFVKLLYFLIKIIKKVIYFIIKAFLLPIKGAIKLFNKPFMFLLKWAKSLIKHLKYVKNRQKTKLRQIKYIFKKI